MLILIVSVITIIVFAAVLSVIKLAILGFFNFMYSKKLFFEYAIYHVILLIILIIVIYQTNTYQDVKMMVGVALPLFLVYAIIEGIVVYKRHFDFESKNKYIGFLVVSYALGFLILNVLLTIYIVFIAALSS